MGIEVNTENGVCHARVEGEMTIYTTGEYREVLLEQCHTRQGMELDLADVTEMDISGVQLLVALKKHLDGTEHGLQMHRPSEAVQEALELTRLAETLETFDDKIEEAVQ